MNSHRVWSRLGRRLAWAWSRATRSMGRAALATALATSGAFCTNTAQGQSELPVAPQKLWLEGTSAHQVPSGMKHDPAVTPVGCASCGTLPPPSFSGEMLLAPCIDGCGSSQCRPGRKRCDIGCNDTASGRLLAGIIDSLCCPDPCYEAKWLPLANNAFFQNSPRPVSQTALRWDAGLNFTKVDRAEYFMARSRTSGAGKGPPYISALDYHDLNLYTEISAGPAFSTFINTAYRRIDPRENSLTGPAGNFGDLTIGTKSVIVDTELWLLTFQFSTFVPTGNFTTGIGTGHVSLEPSLLSALKLSERTYLQAELAQWIPIAGDATFSGSVLRYHAALNHQLFKSPTLLIVGSAEFNGWTMQDGAYTTGIGGGITPTSGDTILSVGPGVRFIICENWDIGFGAAFAITNNQRWAEQLYRTEMRLRF